MFNVNLGQEQWKSAQIKIESTPPNPGTYSAIDFIGVWTNDMSALCKYAVMTFVLPA